MEEKISELLGVPWTITANANLIYANADDESYKSRVGSVIMWYVVLRKPCLDILPQPAHSKIRYMEPFADNLKQYIEKFGDDGKEELNSTCAQHQVEFGPQDKTTFTYGGLDIVEGVLRLVFAPSNFASNVSDVSSDISGALKNAAAASGGSSKFNIVARNSVREDYDPKIEDVQEEIGGLVGVADIKLNPNFESNAAALAKYGDKGRSDWDRILGQSTLAYFEGVVYQLKRNGFKDDEMLQEGFQEGVTKNEISVRIVDKLTGKYGSYNETIIEDGVLFVQASSTPELCVTFILKTDSLVV